MFGKKVNTNLIYLISLSVFVLFFYIYPLYIFAEEGEQVLKDSDFDGVSDDAEINIYKTNAEEADTDNDSAIDAREILDGTDPNKADFNKSNDLEVQEPPLIQRTDPIAWYISRIAGISAFIMFTLVICNGLLITSKLSLRFRNIVLPAKVLEAHMFNATYVAYGLMVLHFGTLFFDQYIKLTLLEIFVPFLLERNFKSALGFDFKIPVAFGVIAIYFATMLVITSQFRGKIVSAKVWRKLHYSSFVFYILFLLHGILSGTDSKEWWMIIIYISSVVCVLGLLITRIFFRKRILQTKASQSVVVNDNL